MTMLDGNPTKILFVLIGLALVGVLLFGVKFNFKQPPTLLVGGSNDPNDLQLGMSGEPVTELPAGPTFLTANVPLYFPAPLAHLNPVVSDQME